MAKKVANKLSTIASKAVGKRCILCSQYISEDEAADGDYIWSKTRRGDICSHKHCYNDEYGKKADS